MILKDDFFYISSFADSGDNIEAELAINATHQIFNGHFPGLPVVPGVCMIQIIKELLESATGKSLMLKQADHIKFLSVINPMEGKPIKASVKYSYKDNNEVHVVASINREETICLKLKAVFVLNNTALLEEE